MNGRCKNCFALCRPGGYFLFSELFLHHGRATVPHMVSRSLQEIMTLLRRISFVPLDRRPMFVLMKLCPPPTPRAGLRSWRGLPWLPQRCSVIGLARAPWPRALPDRAAAGPGKDESPTTELLLCRRPMGQ